MYDVETVVVGGGAMGSATAWQLASRGRSVALLERFAPGHVNGASHGASRNFNTAYADPTYVGMLAESLALWRELEAESATSLLDQVGVVNHGPNPAFDAMVAARAQVGFASEFLTPQAAAERWPGIRFDGRVLHTPEAGRLNADAAVTALQAQAASAGADVRHSTRVRRIEVVDSENVRVITDTQVIRCRRVVVTVGAWTTRLLDGLLAVPTLAVTQEQPAHFALADQSAHAASLASTEWPGFNHSFDAAQARYGYWYSQIYGLYTPGEGVKVGWHGVGPRTDPDARSFTPEAVQLAALQRYVREWLPGADADVLEPISCTYTTTANENFILDRVGPVVVGAGFSGHGFKFTPAVGRILADLATTDAPAPGLFSLSR